MTQPRARATRAAFKDSPRMADRQSPNQTVKQAADKAPFWRRKALSQMTQRRMGEPVRRLRALLPEQADRRGHQRDRVHRRRLPAARRQDLPLLRLCPPPAPREGLRAADPAQRAQAYLAAADLRLPAGGGGQAISPGGTRWCRARGRRCTTAGVSVRGRVAASEKDVPDEQARGVYRELAGEVAEGGAAKAWREREMRARGKKGWGRT